MIALGIVFAVFGISRVVILTTKNVIGAILLKIDSFLESITRFIIQSVTNQVNDQKKYEHEYLIKKNYPTTHHIKLEEIKPIKKKKKDKKYKWVETEAHHWNKKRRKKYEDG